MSAARVRAGRGRSAQARAVLGGGASLFLRRLRFEPGTPLTMFVLVAGTCFVFAALPRLFDAFADDGLRYAVAHAKPLARNVRAFDAGRVPAAGGTAPLAQVAGNAGLLEQELPPSLRKLVAGRTFVVQSSRYILQADRPRIRSGRGLFRYLTLDLQSGVRPHIRLAAGRLPRASGKHVRAPVAHPTDLTGSTASIPGLPNTKAVPLLEVALSIQTARFLRLQVGDRAAFTPDLSDTTIRYVPIRQQQPLVVEVTGLFAALDPAEPFWFGYSPLDVPDVRQGNDLERQDVFAQALVSPDEYGSVLAATRPLQLSYEYRYFVDADRLDAGGLHTLSGDLARLGARYAGTGPLDRRVETGLAQVLDRYRASRSQAETLLAVAAIGLLACALATLGLLGALSYERRRVETAVSRTRGASPRHVLVAQAAEALLIAAPAGLLGWALAALVVGGRASSLSAWLVLAVVVATALVPVAAIAGLVRRPLGPPSRGDAVLARPSARRLSLEALVVVAAGLGVYLLRRRGLAAAGSTTGGVDAYLAGVPVLLGLACGILAVRLYPLPVAAAARLARLGRGLALHLGLSRAARQSDTSSLLPLLVLVLALAIASMSAAMLSTLERGQNRTGWRAIGADLRVDAALDSSLPVGFLSRLDSLGDTARAYVQQADLGSSGPTPLFVALDLPAYERVVAGTPNALRFPRVLSAPSPIPSVVPALVSANWPVNSVFQIGLPDKALGFIPAARRTSFPGVPPRTPFAVVSLRALQNAGSTVMPNRVYLSGPSAAAARQSVRSAAPGAVVSTRAAVVRSLRAAPLVGGVLRGFRAAIVVAALYAAVAVGLMALIVARSRARDLALVRTMGGSQREGTLLAGVELTPFVATALMLGIGLGVEIPHLIAPGLDLAFYTGTRVNPIAIPWLPPTAFAAGLLVLTGSAVLLAGVRMRRAHLDRVLRIGER